MRNSSIIITSIASPNGVMRAIAEKSAESGGAFIVIGDTKSPPDFSLAGCDFYPVEKQRTLPYSLAAKLPEKHYSRKNIGYLLGSRSEVIIETDDDNFPVAGFWDERKRLVDAEHVSARGWINVYRYFSGENIWPRGFPIEQINTSRSTAGHFKRVDCPIQQGLADDNPDVDAIYRMSGRLPVVFDKRNPVSLGEGSWCPFNSQNTTWFKDAFPLLYLPSCCSFRMTDIWRSFVAQRIAWTCGWNVLFHNATMKQDRNEHVLLKDFEDEIPGYLNNARICRLLEEADLQPGIRALPENLIRCYRILVSNNFIGKGELELVESWIKDLGI